MAEVRVTTTTDRKPEIVSLVRRLPALLAGKVPDEHGIAAGFKSRIAHAFFSLILPNFDELGRGQVGAGGEKWPPLTQAYLAYGRRFGPGEKTTLKKNAGLDKSHGLAPGGKSGLLDSQQLKLWRRIYADRLAWYMMREADDKAKAHAAAIAWIIVKEKGGKTKLEVFGKRTVQILVDTGRMRQSIQPGALIESGGPGASYQPAGGLGGADQEFTDEPGRIIVGTNDQKARYHHHGKGRRKRRLWPEEFPQEWWQQILGVAVSGLARIGQLFQGL